LAKAKLADVLKKPPRFLASDVDEGEKPDSHVEYTEVTREEKTYRSFSKDECGMYKHFARVGFPNNGSELLDISTDRLMPTPARPYPEIWISVPCRLHMYYHRVVAF